MKRRYMTNKKTNDDNKNFIEAKMIIQEFHDDSAVFVVGTAPFGKLWFDHDKVTKQYKVLTDSWYEEYGDNETKHSKRPRMVSVLIDESDPMFNKYRNNIREAQQQGNDNGGDKSEDNAVTAKNTENVENVENVVIVSETTNSVAAVSAEKKTTKRTYKKKKKQDAAGDTPTESIEIKPKFKKKKSDSTDASK